MGIDELRDCMREKVMETHLACTDHIMEVITGKKPISDVTKEASKMLTRCLRVDQEMRMERENGVSLTLRLIKLIDDEELKDRYVRMTQPYLPPALRQIESKKKK